MKVQWVKVQSSNLEQVAFDPKTSTLYVRFKSSPSFHYVYDNVKEDMFRQFLAADSLGSFFARQIKGVFEFKKVAG